MSLSYSNDRAEPAGLRDHRGRGTIVLESVSKLTGIRIVYNQNGDAPEEKLLGDVSKEELMRGEAADFAGRSSAGRRCGRKWPAGRT